MHSGLNMFADVVILEPGGSPSSIETSPDYVWIIIVLIALFVLFIIILSLALLKMNKKQPTVANNIEVKLGTRGAEATDKMGANSGVTGEVNNTEVNRGESQDDRDSAIVDNVSKAE